MLDRNKKAFEINYNKINEKCKATSGINRETIALKKLSEKYID